MIKTFVTLTLFIFAPSLALAQFTNPGFEEIPKRFSSRRSSVVMTKFIPPVREQRYLPLCMAFAAASFIDALMCLNWNNVKCGEQPLNKMVSVLDLLRRSKTQSELDAIKKRPDYPKDAWNADAYPGIDLAHSAQLTMFRDSDLQSLLPESLVPYEKIFGGKDGKRTVEEGLVYMQTLNKFYAETQKIVKGKGANGEKAARAFVEKNFATIGSMFGYPNSEHDVKESFLEDNINYFYDRLFIPNLPSNSQLMDKKWDWVTRQYIDIPWDLNRLATYPEYASGENFDENRIGDYAGAIAAIKKAITLGGPAILTSICVRTEPPKKIHDCFELNDKKEKVNFYHTLLVTGYKQVCNAADECFDALRLLNSWGPEWQKQFEHEGLDGWVKAKPLLNRVISSQMLLWYKP